jgi:hypothetical protein
MNCANHPANVAKVTCPICFKPVCGQCLVRAGDREVCLTCFTQESKRPLSSAPNSNAKPLESHSAPGIAFGLGFIPGVGAIYNGEYLKAFLHVLVFGFLISLSNNQSVGSFGPLFGLMVTAFYFFLPLEAYHTAKRRVLEASGFQVESPVRDHRQEALWSGAILTMMGCLLFVNQFVDGFLAQALRFWPVVLIGFGVYRIREYSRKLKPLEAVRE